MRKICIENLPAGLHAFGMQTGKSLILYIGSRYDPEHSGSLELTAPGHFTFKMHNGLF